jgi:hypothetical protein
MPGLGAVAEDDPLAGLTWPPASASDLGAASHPGARAPDRDGQSEAPEARQEPDDETWAGRLTLNDPINGERLLPRITKARATTRPIYQNTRPARLE